MKNILKLLFGSLSLMVATSCQETIDSTPEFAAEREVSIVANYAGDIQSRATAPFETSKSFYIYFNQEIGIEAFAKVKYDEASSSWKIYDANDDTTEKTIKYNPDGGELTIAAVDCGEASLDVAKFLSGDTVYEAGYDMLYASAYTIDKSTATITITFGHLLSQLGVAVTNAPEGATIKKITISGIYNSFKWKGLDNSGLVETGDTAAIEMEGDGSDYTAVMVPQSINGANIVVTTSDYANYYATVSEEDSLTAGYKNTITIDLSESSNGSEPLTVASLAIAKWSK